MVDAVLVYGSENVEPNGTGSSRTETAEIKFLR
jgi:hypothetical protein